MIYEFLDFLSPLASACDPATEEFAPNMQVKIPNMQVKIPAIARLSGPGLADRRIEEPGTFHVAVVRRYNCRGERRRYAEPMHVTDLRFRLSLIWLAVLSLGAIYLLLA
jgi:hypothetical protein